MFSILLSLMADTKVVDNQTEGDGSCFVEEQPWGMVGRVTAMFGKVLFELVVCKFACLSETMDGTHDLNVNTAIRCNFVFELTLVDDLLWDVFEVHFHALAAVSEFCVQTH